MKSNSINISIQSEPQPTITSIISTTAKIGDFITIYGTNFGSSQNTSFVSFSGTQATVYSSWNDSIIKVKVPEGAKTGKLFVYVGDRNSNEFDITINNDIAPTIEMVLIPAGTFQMGNTGSYYGSNSE